VGPVRPGTKGRVLHPQPCLLIEKALHSHVNGNYGGRWGIPAAFMVGAANRRTLASSHVAAVRRVQTKKRKASRFQPLYEARARLSAVGRGRPENCQICSLRNAVADPKCSTISCARSIAALSA
jgi:hypothetical protein